MLDASQIKELIFWIWTLREATFKLGYLSHKGCTTELRDRYRNDVAHAEEMIAEILYHSQWKHD